ncbi:3',5'-cyclic-nucleotide phosphodiesterase [Recurvomyces mirabilis]|uniref:Phosphodiesterase n=1 Tax=Recurvomyces mirabilis TaxID=574656 RepID=A0AAE1C2C3_9PEZI|nr:3',5'-cyclic-nucleotide phosphodiesterase [Recurvomyces mirabilis]KAK5157970.1 3',5'-cyclic-nucleotide phosphodiesterase [Recurvomyces mirabilis]
MEENVEGRCGVVYFCGGLGEEIIQSYRNTSPPRETGHARHIDVVYRNVRALLDENQGGFDEVFVSSSAAECHDRLESHANKVPTVVLVELHDGAAKDARLLADNKQAATFPFLRNLSADINGARYQRPVMPFALVSPSFHEEDVPADATFAASCLEAGALDIFHSPLNDEDLHRLVGHVKEALRPAARLVGSSMAQSLVTSIRSTTPNSSARYRPDESLSPARRKVVEDNVGKWHFPAQTFTMDELTYAAMFMLEHMLQLPDLRFYSIPRAELMTFLLATRRQYKHQREVHYHNWRHAVDVTQSIYCFLLDVRLCPPLANDTREPRQLNAVEGLLTPLDGLILLVSAIGHDVGHPGVNNAFLTACNHPLAQMYNDKSVLENYHCAAYSQLLRRHWPALGNISGFRTTMISTILATDMQRHFEYMSGLGELKRKIEGSENDLSNWNDKDREQARELMMALLMKGADISNVARPFDLSSEWARTLMNEFARQGELEAELGIPTCLFGGPPNKEDILAAAQSQKGFMNLFGIPLFSGMTDVMPSLSCAIRELEQNTAIWEEKITKEKQKRNSGGESSPLTFSSVSKKEVDEAKLQKRQSEPLAVPEDAPGLPTSSTKRQTAVDSALSPRQHPAHSQRQHLTLGLATQDGHRSSLPPMPPPALPLSPNGGASRRSSKDVALDSIQQLSAYAQSSMSPTISSGSRRGSADWQVHQNYPGSRRGSKDESLTTILVTSQSGSPGRGPAGSPIKQSRKRQGTAQSQKPDAVSRYSVPSSTSRSHTTSSATANTTQPSSLAPTDDERTPPASEDPFVVPGNWPSDLDGAQRSADPVKHPSTPDLSTSRAAKSDSPRIIARMASGEGDDGRGTPRKEHAIRESRSRSRLRNLKFWKKKRDPSGVEGGVTDPGSP